MLVFFSDVHLTDGSSGVTINEEAFDQFVDRVGDLAHRRRVDEVRVVLLGDGLDVMRSASWLDAPDTVRPWCRPSEDQRRLVLDILQRIVARNRGALQALRDMPYRIAARSRVPHWRVRFDYVLGNHDWIINRYRATRQVVSDALDLAPSYVKGGFPLVYTSPAHEYDVLARHGNLYDPLNYDRELGHEASSLGDIIIVELLNRFPLEVGKYLADDLNGGEVVRRLKEIDNVRPYSVIAMWVAEVLTKLGQGNPATARVAREALARCVHDFRASGAVREAAARQLTWLQRQYMRLLFHQVCRRQVKALDRLSRFGDRMRHTWRALWGRPDAKYSTEARGEVAEDGFAPRYVVYGHSHRVASVPLGPCVRGGDRFYLNTGTWRAVWERAETDDGAPHFASWKEMSYVVVYSPHEGSGAHEFELWTGSLRDRPGRAVRRGEPERVPEPPRPRPDRLRTPPRPTSPVG